jgi:5'-phosphate synthase pdxT subunit
MAKRVTNPLQGSLGLIDIEVERNAYGRQLDSRVVRLQPEFEGGDLEAVFIRAPIVRNVGPGGKVRMTYNGDPVLVEEGRHMVTTFHPELGSDDRIHRMFLDKVE